VAASSIIRQTPDSSVGSKDKSDIQDQGPKLQGQGLKNLQGQGPKIVLKDPLRTPISD